ncbi:DUF2169 family type VI secretion system accessory protein [Polyangium jinanense]|uniref:DUF2169 domain-containing protein n=1 Tax=Polyangium jinanense TaxID=2829994 RepID=A0A9X3XH38_9BACT|nr:DUF2169 domain-containing protein [Polyangium jinanense]MDC3961455.1 DUF2169 domain-containing protein [Polyangium jinanense]MDC3987886.1 DUF2169 domain-containing protein [Polyangium jinanense]
MDIITIPPFLTSSVTWQEQPGQWSLTVVCKVTYALKPGTSIVATEPEGVNERDNHWDDDPGKCVYAPSDLAPYKPRPEVLLVGSAFAPRREPLRSLFARLVVADVDKSIEVLGARTVARDGAVSEAQKWTQMPLRYERAAGGDESWNPVGIDPSVVDAYGRRTLPNLQPPGMMAADVPRPIPTVGFGPIASRWLVRSAKLGALVGAFANGTWAETPLGMDFDGSYFQSAPSDQLVSELRPDEPILLENMHPEIERFSTRLPGIKPHMRVEIEGLPPWEPDLVPDTLWIDTNRAIASLTFRAQIPLDGRDQPGRIFIGVEYPGESVRFPEPTRSAHEPTPAIDEDDDDLDLTQTTADSLRGLGVNPLPFAASPALPFAPGAAAPQPPPSQAPPRPRPPPEEDANDTAVFVGTIPRDAMPAWLAGKKNPPAPVPAPAPAMAAPPPAMPVAPPPMTQLRRPAEPAAPAPPPIVAPPPPIAAPPPPIPTPLQAPLAPAPPRPQVPSLPGVVVPHSAPPAPALPIQPPPVTRPSGTTVGQEAVLAAQKARPEPPAAPPAPFEKDRSRPGKSDPRVLATAAFLGAAEASHAAATAPTEDDREKERRDKPTVTTPAAAPAPVGFLVDLLWFAPELPPRLPENETWKPLFEPTAPAVPEEPADEASEDPWNDEDPEAPPPKPRKKPERKKEKTPEEKAKEDKSRVSKVLTRGIPTLDVENALFSAVNDDGVLEPPLLVVAGELELPFDEIEVLKVLSSAAAPLAVGDKKLKETLDLANEALGTPLGSSADVAANFSLRVREAWAKANRMLPPDYLDVHSRRVLLEQRKYQKRELSGAEWIRALLHGPMADKGIPTYLPIELSKKLPLFSRFSARLIVEALPQQDQSESPIVALRVLALARTVAGRPKR